ncbi:MAG: membrane integrity-associated transporter subunit PqiC [Alphaproteobacteria bacterium]|nr:membrane integrity-associated transporter subunit PqiC [Alphaproteobacteria bacterium]
MTRRALLLGAGSGLLGGCTGLLPGTGPAPNVYDLSPKSRFREDIPRVSWQLVVEEPLAASGIDTTRIALKPNALEIKYFADARWSDRAPRMVQTLLVESFENSGKIIAIGRQSLGLRSDYNLKSELREFQAEYMNDRDPPVIRVRLSLKLIRQPRQEIVAAENFEHTVPAPGPDIRSVVAGFDQALDRVLKSTIEWTLTVVPPDLPKA